MTTIKEKKIKPVSESSKSEKKRSDIVRAATEIINAKSYAEATVIDIAAALNLRDAALYYYYPDKRALAYACHCTSLQRCEQLLKNADEAGETGEKKLRYFFHTMLVDSSQNGPLLYFGDYSYLEEPQRAIISAWADRLKDILVKFLSEGMVDGSIVQCEPELVVHLLLGMLIWLSKWVPAINGMTVERLMSAIDAVCFRGLDHSPFVFIEQASKSKSAKKMPPINADAASERLAKARKKKAS